VLAADDDKAEHALLFALDQLSLLGLHAPKLLAIGQNHIHVLVKGYQVGIDASLEFEKN